MGSRGLLVILLLLASAALVVPLPARAAGPAIMNVAWTPWVPAYHENITVEADVSTPTGSLNVTASWCILPLFTCIPYPLSDPDGDGRYSTDPDGAGPQRSPIHAADMAGMQPATGAEFNVSATDADGNTSFTAEMYVAYASTITVDAALSPADPIPGQAVTVTGTAIYQNNSSVPAVWSAVTFEILETGMRWSTMTDGTGAFASGFNAPAAIGSYTLRTTISNRTIAGSQDRYLAVATAPTPDLAVVSGSLVATPANATAGDTVTISFSVENRGTAAAGVFGVLVNVSGPSGLLLSRPLSVGALQPGERRALSATWTAVEGSWTVTVFLDSGGQVAELSEANNRVEMPLTVRPLPSQGPSVMLIAGVAIVGAGVAAAVALVYRRRAGRRKEP